MASLQISGVEGQTVERALRHASVLAGQKVNRPADVTIDLTAGVITVTDNTSPNSGPTSQKF